MIVDLTQSYDDYVFLRAMHAAIFIPRNSYVMNVKLYVYVICACCTCVCVLYIDMCQEMDREILGNIVDGNAALAAIAGKSQTLRSSLDLFKVVKECVNEIAASTKHIGVATLESRPTPFVPDKQYVYEVNVLINSHEKILGAIDKFRKDVYLLHFAPGHGEHLYKEVYSQVGIEKLGLKVNDEKFQVSVVAAGKIVVAAQKHTQKKKEEEECSQETPGNFHDQRQGRRRGGHSGPGRYQGYYRDGFQQGGGNYQSWNHDNNYYGMRGGGYPKGGFPNQNWVNNSPHFNNSQQNFLPQNSAGFFHQNPNQFSSMGYGGYSNGFKK